MKRIIALTISISMIMCMSVNAYATESSQPSLEKGASVYLRADAKKAFVASVDKKKADCVTVCSLENDERAAVIDALLLEVSVAGESRSNIVQTLEYYGVYEFIGETVATKQTKNLSRTTPDSSNVELNTPGVFYDSITREWVVTCGGEWVDNSWRHLIEFLPHDVGGADAFGVGFTNTGGTYNATVQRASASLRVVDDTSRVKNTQHRSDGDGEHGFGFQLQDYTYYDADQELHYLGSKWSGTCYYSQSFTNFSGVATAYYIHTFDSAEIEDISFGVTGKEAGVDVTISSTSKSFVAYSSDKLF